MAAARAVRSARTTPLPEIGSTASAASPTAIHRASYAARRSRWLAAGNTRGPHPTGPATRAAVRRVAASRSCQRPGMETRRPRQTSVSVISMATIRPAAAGAEYHQPSGMASTSTNPSSPASTPSSRAATPTSRSNTADRPPSWRPIRAARPVASTSTRARTRSPAGRASSVMLRSQQPPWSARTHVVAQRNSAPASAAASASMRSNATRSTCQPQPYGLTRWEWLCGSGPPQTLRVPYDGSGRRPVNRGHTPSSVSSAVVAGASDSPTRGASNRDRSSSTTRQPDPASRRAVAEPAGPAPTTATSYSSATTAGG